MPSLVPPETSEQACCLPSQEIAAGPGSAWGVLPILAPYLGSLYVRDDPQSQGRGDRPGAGRLAELAQHRRDMVPDGFSDKKSRCATSALERPSASRPSTSTSRGVSPAGLARLAGRGPRGTVRP